MIDVSSYLTASDVCARFGVERRTLGRWLASSALRFPRPVRIRGRRYFAKAAVDAWQAQLVADDLPPTPAAADAPIISPIITDYDSLVSAMKRRRRDLGMTLNALDERSGMQMGYSAKLEMKDSSPSARAVGKVSLPLWLGALNVGLALVDLSKQPQGTPS